MNAAKRVSPKRKTKGNGSDKGRSKASKGRKAQAGSHEDHESNSSDEEVEDEFVNRRAKRPKTGRIGRTAGKNYPPEIQRALGRAHMLYVEGNVPDASRQLSEVVVQCPSIPEPYALLALIYQDSGKYQEALVFYKLACTRDPRKLGNHREAARIAGILGDHASRLEALKVLARLQPSNLNVAIDRARCLLELQKPKQALDVYAKATKRFPRRYDIYLDLAEGVECQTPQQHLFVHQALASCLRRTVGKKHLGPDVRELADGFAVRLREIKLEKPKPKRLPPRPLGLPSKRVSEVAMAATDLLVAKLMESRKRQEPQYEVGVQVVEGLVSWLDACRTMASRADADYESEEEGGSEEEEEDVDSDSDLRDSNDEGSDDEEDETEGSSAEEDADQNGAEEEDHRSMDRFTLAPSILLRYGICQLYCGEKAKASKAFAFLDHEEPDGPYGDMMLEVAKVYAETDHIAESLVLLQQVAQSEHPRHRLAGIQLGAAYASQGKHELAAEAYTAVLTERPHHAAALAGLAEAAYWRGKAAVPSALNALTPAVSKADEAWAEEIPAVSPDDDEGEEATGFQRLQLLMQWSTLSRMNGNAGDFACVALPLVSAALGQLGQRRAFDKQQASAVLAPNEGGAARESGEGKSMPGADVETERAGQVAEEKRAEEGGASDQTSAKKSQSAVWKPGPVPVLLGKMNWQVDLKRRMSSLAVRLLGTTDVIAQVGRRAVFWQLVELVRALLELGNSAEVEELVATAAKPNGLLRGLEKEDLQAVAANDDMAILSTLPGGCPIRGPASREGLLLGPTNPGDLQSGSVRDLDASITPSEQYYAPPWRCVEEKDDEGIPRRAGRAWRPSNRPSLAGPRRSRSRALMELAENKDDGDAISALVRALSRTPGNDAMWNMLQRIATERGVETGDGGFHGEKVEALVSRHRERAQGLLYRAHDSAAWNRSKPALKLYRQSHVLRPEEPLPILCLGTHIIRMVTVMETMVECDGTCILQALACLHLYAELRAKRAVGGTHSGNKASSGSAPPAIPQAVLEQEAMYNLGRAYHQVGLAELAMEYYNRALRVEDERGHELRNWHGGDGLTKETAHNLCALYKRNGATAMALRVLNKYLAVG